MTKRSIIGMILLNFVTIVIYHYYWLIKTKHEMVSQGADIPTSLLLFIPIANIYWMWKWSVGVEHVSRGRMSGGVSFLLMFLIGYIIGPAIIQSTFNGIADEQVRGQLPQARIA
jgi:hypothetical protein